ncbi:MAG TPA: phage holin family protein [Steroidobacteraceae bacterium]|jgi:uncharacterized membrane protein YqjE|nr:phage holin family protein [Steroidobacteraceae bacterium]
MSEPDASTSTAPASGLFRSLSNLLATLVELAQTRFELLTTEIQEEIQRAATLLIWGSIALLASGIGVFFVGITIIVAFWDTHRLAAAIAVTGTVIAIMVIAIVVLRTQIRSRRRLMDATRSELEKDRQQFSDRR